jgi:hypothetical protein
MICPDVQNHAHPILWHYSCNPEQSAFFRAQQPIVLHGAAQWANPLLHVIILAHDELL